MLLSLLTSCNHFISGPLLLSIGNSEPAGHSFLYKTQNDSATLDTARYLVQKKWCLSELWQIYDGLHIHEIFLCKEMYGYMENRVWSCGKSKIVRYVMRYDVRGEQWWVCDTRAVEDEIHDIRLQKLGLFCIWYLLLVQLWMKTYVCSGV